MAKYCVKINASAQFRRFRDYQINKCYFSQEQINKKKTCSRSCACMPASRFSIAMQHLMEYKKIEEQMQRNHTDTHTVVIFFKP